MVSLWSDLRLIVFKYAASSPKLSVTTQCGRWHFQLRRCVTSPAVQRVVCSQELCRATSWSGEVRQHEAAIASADASQHVWMCDETTNDRLLACVCVCVKV